MKSIATASLFLAAAGAAFTLYGCGRKTTIVEKPNGDVVVRQPTDSNIVVTRPESGYSREVLVVQPEPPPPPPAERRVAPPAPDYIWVPGAYEWRNGRWEWVPGYYHRPAAATMRWEPGHWEKVPGGYVWAPGTWR